MSSGPTKSWLTPARLERGPEAAEAELRRWNLTEEDKAEFRRLFGEKWTSHGRLEDPKGVVEKLRKASEKARRAEEAIGRTLTARDPGAARKREKLVAELRRAKLERRGLASRIRRLEGTGAPFMRRHPAFERAITPIGLALGAVAAVGGGYLVGRWWRARRAAAAADRVRGSEPGAAPESNPYLVGAAVLGAI